MKELKLKAMAKINLGLDVLRKREDGYHDLRMIMQTIYLYDRIELTETAEPGIQVQTNLSFLPVNEDNLVYKAAKLLMDEFEIRQGVKIVLYKYIPVAAGLAGGSSDAAAVLVGLNRMFQLDLTQEELMARGVKIGADVPYCIMRGTALAEGIGEKLTRLPDAPDCHVLIAKPPVHVSTQFVYGNLRAAELTYHPDIDGQVQAIHDGDFYGMAKHMGNVLETVTIPAHPVIQEIKDVMMREGAVNAMMSGSGPTVFGLFDDPEKAQAAYELLNRDQMAKKLQMNEYLPLRDVVFQTLRQAILRGELKPGERLMEIHLAQSLGVSRTPVREAIRKLELEGLVVMIPRKGAVVAGITISDLQDVLEVRMALEELAVKYACRRVTQEQLEELRRRSEIFKKTLSGNDVGLCAEADVAFHDMIYLATGNNRLVQILNNIREQMYRYRMEYLKDRQSHSMLVQEHEAILEALMSGDEKTALEVTCKHIERQKEHIMSVLNAER